MQDADVIVIGSGLGGLTAAALLARYGQRVIVCESHTIPGGTAHSFERQGFVFDSGPSFYCGLGDAKSLNPLRQVLDVLGEEVEAIPYDPLGYYHFPDGTLPVYGDAQKYRQAIAQFTPQGAAELEQLERQMMAIYEALRGIPTLALRSDWQLIVTLLSRYPLALLKLLPHVSAIQGSFGDLVERTVRDPWVRRLLDVECFLLSGLKAKDTVAPEMAFMFGERSQSVVDYPKGGSGAIVDALVRGLERYGGKLRLGTHIERILVENNQAVGVELRSGEQLRAGTVISNATVWDTYSKLLQADQLPSNYRQQALQTRPIESFMHLHLGIRADGLSDLAIHHVVVHDDRDITTPGNTCMISIPTVLDPSLAPAGHHVVHAYTLEPWEGWPELCNDRLAYEERKRDRTSTLFRAVEKVIPDIRDRIVLELTGSPLTHARFLRRYQGTYGPAIPAKEGMFPSCHTPIRGLYRVGDSTIPGIGVPAVVASGILCANTLVRLEDTGEILECLG